MSSIPKQFINELLAKVNLVDVISTRVSLKKSGRDYQARCPFHDEKTPSFTVSEEKQFYHCFGCGANGNSIGFMMAYDNLDFVEAVEELAKYAGMTVVKSSAHQQNMGVDPYVLLDDCAQFYESQLKYNASAQDYVVQRGLTEAVIQQFRMGYAPDQWDSLTKKMGGKAEITKALKTLDVVGVNQQGNEYDRFRHRLMFPIQDRRGRVLGFGARVLRAEDQPKYLNTAETPIFRKREELYGLHQCLQASNKPECLLVTEGYMDVVALHQVGLPVAVAAMGTAISVQQLTQLFRYTKKVVMCFDGDTAGQNAANKALKNILPAMRDSWKVQFLMLPTGEDPDSYVKQQGREAFETLLDEAIGMIDFIRQDLGSLGTVGKHEDLPSMIGAAQEWLKLCPQNGWQQALLKSMSEFLMVDVQALKLTHVRNNSQQDSAVSGFITSGMRSKRALNNEQKMIVLILNFPQLVQDLVDAEVSSLSAISPILSNLTSLLKAKIIPGAALVEYWKNTPDEALLQELLMYENLLDEKQSLAELKHLIERFKRDALGMKWQKVHEKVQLMGIDVLTEEEKNIYRSPPLKKIYCQRIT